MLKVPKNVRVILEGRFVSAAGTIHISETTNQFLSEVFGTYITKPRGEMSFKGGDSLFSFWLLGKKSKTIEDRTGQSVTSGDSANKCDESKQTAAEKQRRKK